jgi:oxygen-independent coproporphyrinogen-3 oxidase
VQLAEDMLGFGVTAIGFLENCFFQNLKEIETYEKKIGQNALPIFRGFILGADDLIRRWTIQELMCHFELDKEEFFKQFGLNFDLYFSDVQTRLKQLECDGLIEKREDKISPTPLGRLFIRLIASLFDAYLDKGKYSRAI